GSAEDSGWTRLNVGERPTTPGTKLELVIPIDQETEVADRCRWSATSGDLSGPGRCHQRRTPGNRCIGPGPLRRRVRCALRAGHQLRPVTVQDGHELIVLDIPE